MLSMCVLLVVGAQPVKVAAGAFSYSGIEESLGGVYVEQFETMLADHGLKVTTQKDLANILGLQRQKELLGCADDTTSCSAELAAALGVDAMLVGSIAKTPEALLVTFKFIGASSGDVLASVNARVPSEAALFEWFTAAAPKVAGQAIDAIEELRAKREGRRPLWPVLRWFPGGLGVGAAVVGAILFGQSRGELAVLQRLSFGDPSIDATVTRGQSLQDWGMALMVSGAGLIAATTVWVVLTRSSEVTVSWVPTPGGLGFAVGGHLP